MYGWPTRLEPVSNREDFVLPVSIFDDELKQPINLSGTNGTAFTGASWTVTDGAIVTASVTSIAIPAFPIGNQLSALALTVGTNLGILAGDPVSIVDPSGQNTMLGYVISYAKATGALVAQIGMSFTFEIRKQGPHSPGYGYGGYPAFFDFGTPSGNAAELSASLGNGILITELGYLQITIPEVMFKKLRSGTYRASLVMSDSVNTRQLFVADLPVIYGGVTS
jgi:hypothetical protein